MKNLLSNKKLIAVEICGLIAVVITGAVLIYLPDEKEQVIEKQNTIVKPQVKAVEMRETPAVEKAADFKAIQTKAVQTKQSAKSLPLNMPANFAYASIFTEVPLNCIIGSAMAETDCAKAFHWL